MLTNIQAVELFRLSQTEEFGLISFKQPRQYILVQRNIKKLKELYESLSETEKKVLKPSEEYMEYESVNIASISPYLVKDDSGKVIRNKDGSVNIIEGNEEAVKTIFLNLNETFKAVIDEQNSKQVSWAEFLNSEAEVKIDLIPVDDVTLPNEGFNKHKFDILSLMLDVSEE